MTIDSENSYRELGWTGVETSFNPQFRAERVEDVSAKYVNALSVISDLVRGTHFNVTLDGTGNVTVTPLAMPAAPGTLQITRNTQALQPTDFIDLESFPAATFTFLFDRLTMIAGEARRAIARAIGPFTTIGDVVDFRTYRIKAADPIDDQDVTTKSWVLIQTGLISLIGYVNAAAASAAAAAVSAAASLTSKTGSETARDKAQLWSDQAEDTPVQGAEYSAFHWYRKSLAAAATILPYLTETDDGLFGTADAGSQDDGAF